MIDKMNEIKLNSFQITLDGKFILSYNKTRFLQDGFKYICSHNWQYDFFVP